jgi:hypothetical protein
LLWGRENDEALDGVVCTKAHKWHWLKKGDILNGKDIYFIYIFNDGYKLFYIKNLHHMYTHPFNHVAQIPYIKTFIYVLKIYDHFLITCIVKCLNIHGSFFLKTY